MTEQSKERNVVVFILGSLGVAFVSIYLVSLGGFVLAALAGYGYRAITGRSPFWLEGTGIAALSTLLFLTLALLQNLFRVPILPLWAGTGLGMAALLVLLIGYRKIYGAIPRRSKERVVASDEAHAVVTSRFRRLQPPGLPRATRR